MSVAREQAAGSSVAPRIVETPGVCGGYPRVWNTRIRVGLIIEAYRQVGGDVERTVEVYPQLTREQIQAALDYYAAHRARVDEDIERDHRALAALEVERGRTED
jgi:uncharacterized protein (DUF433 family)